MNNRYKIGLSIINNNGGLVVMLNKIYTKCYKMLENVLEWVGYNYIGYKVDIEALKKDVKTLQICNKMKDTINNNFIDKDEELEEEIKALKKEIKALKKYDSLLNTPFKDDDYDGGWVSCEAQDNDTLKRVAKILKAYDNDGIDFIIDDIIDDLNDEFKGFNYIFDDINLSN